MSELRFWRYQAGGGGEGGGGGSWSLERSVKDEGYKVVSASGVNPDETDDIWVTTDGFTQPPTLSLATASAPAVREPLKSLPAFYEAAGLQTQQLYATSADGTRVPYFLVAPQDMSLDGSTPTLLYGYGGFEVSLTPGYSAEVGAACARSVNIPGVRTDAVAASGVPVSVRANRGVGIDAACGQLRLKTEKKTAATQELGLAG